MRTSLLTTTKNSVPKTSTSAQNGTGAAATPTEIAEKSKIRGGELTLLTRNVVRWACRRS